MAGGEHGVNGQNEETRAMEEGSRDHQARCENSEQDGGGSKSSSNHPMFSVQFAQKVIAEILGTFFLIFAGCAAVAVNKRTGGTVTFPGICITWGLAVMVMVYSVGHISGAHLNPAVTLAFATCGRFPWRRVPAYAAAQVAGSAAASAALRALFGGAPEHFFGTVPSGSDVQSLVMEFIITFYLMFVVSGVATDNRAIQVSMPISGASMNPARTIGPAIILGRYTSIWVYIAGPVFGAVAGAWAYNLIRFTDKPLREITMTASFIRSTRRN
uniref:Aquaporin n=1 Tax=Oryza meridionalis TaxID=40149 RepID=A0A0E0DN70_9ORYZ